MLSLILRYLPVLLSVSVFCALGVWSFFASQRALERSPQQLDWIPQHDRGGYPFVRDAFPKVRADWLGVFGSAVFALVAGIGCAVLRNRYLGASWLGGLFSAPTLGAICLSVVGAVSMYFLLQRLFGSTLISTCGALLATASYVGAHTAGATLTLALLLLVLWLTAEKEAPFPTELLYWASCLALAGALALRPALLPAVLLFMGLHLFKLISLLRHDKLTPGRLALLLILALLVWAVSVAAYSLLRYFYHGSFTNGVFRSMLQDYGLLRVLLLQCTVGLRLVLQPLTRARLLLPLMDAPLLAFGALGALSGILLWTRRQDARAKLILPILGTLVLIWLLSDVSVLSVGLTLTTALLFHNFLRDRVKLPVVLLTVLGVACLLAFYYLAYRLPMTASILARLS